MFTNKLSPLRVCRMFQGKSIHIVGARAKIDPSRLSLLERNIVQPSADEKRRLARVLRARVKDLFPREVSNA